MSAIRVGNEDRRMRGQSGRGSGNGSSRDSGRGHFVLENAFGETVRVFHWESEEIFLIQRGDSRRVESVSSLEELDQKEISYVVLASSSVEAIKTAPLKIGEVGAVRFIEAVSTFNPEFELGPEAKLEPKKMVGLSVGLLAGFLGLFVIAGLASGTHNKKEETEVTLLPQAAVEKILETAKLEARPEALPKNLPAPVAPREKVVVAMSETKINKNVKIPPNAKRGARTNLRGGGGWKSPGKRGYGTNEPQMNEIGALGAFDQSKRVKGGNGGSGGLNLQAVGHAPGSGAGGTGYGGFGNNGSGGKGKGGIGTGKGMGMSNAMYGKGLIAAPFGDGGGAPGSGGYGTRGRAGGGAQGAGYGHSTVVGSWKGTGPTGDGPAGSGWGKGGDGWGAGLEAGDATVSGGGLDREQVEAVINRNIGQIRYCYEQGLQVSPNLSGRVGVRFQIGPAGRVTTASVGRSSLRNARVESCILGKLRSWGFPRPQGGVHVAVSYPFLLNRAAQN